jgi:hypothetical protein
VVLTEYLRNYSHFKSDKQARALASFAWFGACTSDVSQERSRYNYRWVGSGERAQRFSCFGAAVHAYCLTIRSLTIKLTCRCQAWRRAVITGRFPRPHDLGVQRAWRCRKTGMRTSQYENKRRRTILVIVPESGQVLWTSAVAQIRNSLCYVYSAVGPLSNLRRDELASKAAASLI